MSATNRGGERIHNDGYPTPRWCVHRLLEKLSLPGGVWLDPCAGHGQIIRAVAETRKDILWMALEKEWSYQVGLSELGFDSSIVTDYLDLDASSLHVDVIITNPPYEVADQFVQRALDHADHVVMLLRLNWIAPSSRSFLSVAMPDLYILPNRPSFMVKENKEGKKVSNDATEYAWCYWDTKNLKSTGQVYRLEETAVAIRNLYKEEAKRLFNLYFGKQ